MKNRLYVTVLAIVATMSAVSCSKDFDSSYDYNDTYSNYSQYHNEPPKKTLPAKVIFDYTFGSFQFFPELMTNLVNFDSSLTSDTTSTHGYYLERLNDTTWKLFNNDNSTIIIDTHGQHITQNGAQWNVFCKLDNNYIPEGGCTLTNNDGTINLSISSARFGNSFQATASLDVTWKEILLNQAYPYLFTFNGSGTLTDLSDKKFLIKYSTTTPFVGVDTSLFSQQWYNFFNGTLSISTERDGKTVDELTATLDYYDNIIINYNGEEDTWTYRYWVMW